MGSINSKNGGTNIAPLNSPGFDDLALIPWQSDQPITIVFGIRSTPHTISTPNAIAVVQYLDPETNEIVVENHPIGGFGNSIISIDTGVPIGSPLSVGEVKIGITNSSVLQNATGAGLIARALGRLVGGITGTDSIRESSQFLVFLQSIANTHDDLHSKLPVPTPSPKECLGDT